MSTFHCNACGRPIFRFEHLIGQRSIWEKHGFQAECYVVSQLLDLDTLRRYDDTAHQGWYCCRFIARRMTVDKYQTGNGFLVYTDSVTEVREGEAPPLSSNQPTGATRLTERDFDGVIQSADPSALLVVKFGAVWCPPCRLMDAMFARIYEAGEADGIPGVRIFEMDVDEEPFLKTRWNFRSIPLTMFFRNGKQIDISGLGFATVSGGLNGALPDAAFLRLCQALLASSPKEESPKEN